METRYLKQTRFAPIGIEGQERLKKSTAAIVGCGALGSMIAEILARAGVGKLILIDRDLIEESNLQRQFLYDLKDLKEGLPKVEAAKRRIAEINPGVEVRAENQSLTESNAEALLQGAELILDGTDNFQARYVINDFAVLHSLPWVYGAAVSSYGLTMTVIPKETACLRCVFPEAPAAENSPNCDTAGVIAPITATIGAIEAAEALKILSGNRQNISRELLSIDLWSGPIHSLRPQRRTDCPSCGENPTIQSTVQPRKENLSSSNEIHAESLCGRNAVQISLNNSGSGQKCDLETEAKRLAQKTTVLSQNKFLLRFAAEGMEASLFPDGRLIVWETTDIETAKDFYRRFFV